MKPENPNSHQLSAEEGHQLLDLARQTITAQLGIAQPQPAAIDMKAPFLAMRRGTFVTLKKAGDLRGCIGSLTADQSLGDNVRTNAINAAFHDPRFPPVTAEEWPQIEIEVSILSPPRKLDYASGAELPNRLTPHEDGVVIRKGYASATFLPQVWQQLPRPQDFLAHLCLKAGLAADEWRQGDLEVERYQVQYFDE
jgi:AmmeMemoRadiSam system protein A